MLPAKVTVRGAVIRNVKPYSRANITIAVVLWEKIIRPKQAMRARKQTAVGRVEPYRSASAPADMTPKSPTKPMRA